MSLAHSTRGSHVHVVVGLLYTYRNFWSGDSSDPLHVGYPRHSCCDTSSMLCEVRAIFVDDQGVGSYAGGGWARYGLVCM
ncbi:unnamed protein product [Peniophora sp. CBMAI 1063]|nr:unnamed protein product [Peniophora sp. CBMAI 1063]